MTWNLHGSVSSSSSGSLARVSEFGTALAIFCHARGKAVGMPCCTVLGSLPRTLLFHLGSIAIEPFLFALLLLRPMRGAAARCLVIAGAVAIFYHARGEAVDMPRCTVLVSLRRALLFHLGSVAVGSFLVALLQFVRWALAWIDRRTKLLQRGGVRGSAPAPHFALPPSHGAGLCVLGACMDRPTN